MTAFIATVTEHRGWITQDHAVHDSRDGSVMEETEKVFMLPDCNMIVGGAGSYPIMHDWPRFLADCAKGEVVGLAEMVPEHLRDFESRGYCGEAETHVVHVGHSPNEGRVVGYFFRRSNGFEPERFEGTLYMPELAPDAPGYDALARRWDDAQRGNGVVGLHEAILANQLWMLRQGRYGYAEGLSRTYTTATVDADGPRIEHQGTAAPLAGSGRPGSLIA